MVSGVSETQTPDDSIGTLPQFKADRWGFPAMLILGLFMATISWNRWADLIVDYGQQLYIPWQISEGKILYRDLDYLFGPFSGYFNALLFKIFGVHINVLVWFNLILIVVLCFIIYRVFKFFGDTLTANLATITFLAMFAFGQYFGGGNFNFVCPYSYELSHGVFMSFLALHLFTLNLENPKCSRWIWIGLLSGCVYLTKPEVFLALIAATTLGLFYMNRYKTLPKGSLYVFILSFFAPPLIALLHFWTQVPLNEAIRYLLIPWLHVLGSNVNDLPMYKSMMGTDYLGDNIRKMFFSFSIISGVCIVLLTITHAAGKYVKNLNVLGWGISIIFLASLLFTYYSFPGLMYSRSLPLFVLFGSIYLSLKLKFPFSNHSRRQLGLLVFSIFSFFLLFKIFFNVQVIYYGFALTLPATLFLIHLLAYEIPQGIKKFNFSTGVMRPVLLTLVTVVVGMHIHFEYRKYDMKGQPVGKRGDVILDYHSFNNPRGLIFSAAMDFIEQEIPEGTSFASIPGSIMMNFQTRRENSIKYIYLVPGAIQLIGDYRLYQDLKAAPPPFIVMTHEIFSQQGSTFFGKDFGRDVHQWILKNYDLIQQFGAEPFTSDRFGIQIYKRKHLNKEVA